MGTLRIPNAKKWTFERVSEELVAIRLHAAEADVACMEVALIKQGLYKQVWKYWKTIFAENDDIMEAIMLVESIFQARLLEGMLNKKIPPSVGQFILKNCYKWTDKPEIEEEKKGRVDLVYLCEDKIFIFDSTSGHQGYYVPDTSKPVWEQSASQEEVAEAEKPS